MGRMFHAIVHQQRFVLLCLHCLIRASMSSSPQKAGQALVWSHSCPAALAYSCQAVATDPSPDSACWMPALPAIHQEDGSAGYRPAGGRSR